MGRPLQVDESKSPKPDGRVPVSAFQDFVLLAVPAQMYRALSDAAAARQLTTAELLAKAVSDLLGAEPTSEPKLLTEKK